MGEKPTVRRRRWAGKRRPSRDQRKEQLMPASKSTNPPLPMLLASTNWLATTTTTSARRTSLYLLPSMTGLNRGINEALYIKALKHSINMDPGRHHLSSHFDSILESTIIAPPCPHNTDNEALINTMPCRQGRPRREPIQPAVTATKSSTSQQQPSQRIHEKH